MNRYPSDTCKAPCQTGLGHAPDNGCQMGEGRLRRGAGAPRTSPLRTKSSARGLLVATRHHRCWHRGLGNTSGAVTKGEPQQHPRCLTPAPQSAPWHPGTTHGCKSPWIPALSGDRRARREPIPTQSHPGSLPDPNPGGGGKARPCCQAPPSRSTPLTPCNYGLLRLLGASGVTSPRVPAPGAEQLKSLVPPGEQSAPSSARSRER